MARPEGELKKMTLLLVLTVCGVLPACEAALSQYNSVVFWDATHLLKAFSSEARVFKIWTRSGLDCARMCSGDENCAVFVFWAGVTSAGSCEGHSRIVYSEDPASPASGWKSFVRKYSAGALTCKSSGAQIVVEPTLGLAKEVYCEEEWIVVLRRQDGTEDFYRDWNEYTKGFGDVQGEVWFGLEDLHKITNLHNYDLMVELRDWDDIAQNFTYTNFSVTSSADSYRLHVDLVEGTTNDSLSDHNGHRFSTYDRDNDVWDKKQCAQKMRGAWWYTKCASTNLCGDYKNTSYAPDKTGITWKAWRGTMYSLKFAQMKIRPV